jgi:hypothetical protein
VGGGGGRHAGWTHGARHDESLAPSLHSTLTLVGGSRLTPHVGCSSPCPLAGLCLLQDLNLQGCRNLANTPGQTLAGLPALHRLTGLSLRGCDRLTGVQLEGGGGGGG